MKAPADISVTEVIASYLTHCETYYRKADGSESGSMRSIAPALRLFRETYGQCAAAALGPLDTRAFQAVLVETRAGGRKGGDAPKRSRQYCNKVVAQVKRMYRWAATVELVPESTYRAIALCPSLQPGRSAAREAKAIKPVSLEDFDKTLPYLAPVPHDIVEFMQWTGCRPGEALSLRPIDVDRTRDPWEYRPASHKGSWRGKDRVIFIGPEAQKVLLPYLLRPADAHVFNPKDCLERWWKEKRVARKSKVQPSQMDRAKESPSKRPREYYDRHSLAHAIRRACDRAGVPGWHANQLRHLRATELRKLYGVEAASVILGHSRLNVTEVDAEKNLDLAAQIAKECG